jgi:hypothetical protein
LLLARPTFTVATNKPRICSDPLTVAEIGDSAQISELAAKPRKPICQFRTAVSAVREFADEQSEWFRVSHDSQ